MCPLLEDTLENLWEQLIADDHARALPSAGPRRVVPKWPPRQVAALSGMRHAGKTRLMHQLIRELVHEGAPRESLLYLNFEDERLWQVGPPDLGLIPRIFYRRYPELKKRECAFFFDEVHRVPGWEGFVSQFTDSTRARVCVSGASARLFRGELNSSLKGRLVVTELFPLSFVEYLDFHEVPLPEAGARASRRQRSELEARLLGYLQQGGFPEVQRLEQEERGDVLQSQLDTSLLRDVVERHRVSNLPVLRSLLRKAIHEPAMFFSVHRFYSELRERGLRVSKGTIHDILEQLKDAFLVFPIPIHTASERVRHSNPRKLYPMDPGMVSACSNAAGTSLGRLLETFVFLHLRRHTSKISYYRHVDGTEVDFVADMGDHEMLVQVSPDLTSQDTRQRLLGALGSAMERLVIDSAVLVTSTAEEVIELEHGRVEVVPAWRWAIDLG